MQPNPRNKRNILFTVEREENVPISFLGIKLHKKWSFCSVNVFFAILGSSTPHFIKSVCLVVPRQILNFFADSFTCNLFSTLSHRILWFAPLINLYMIPLDTGRKLNVHEMFRNHLLNVVYTFSLLPVSRSDKI